MKVLTLLTVIVAVSGVPFSDDPGIIGGQNAPASGVPYMVSLRYANGKHHCGGAIIATQYILTAAHCIDDENGAAFIVAGSNTLSSGGTSYNVVRKIIHPNWDINTLKADIGLILVDRPIQMTNRVQIIGIADQNTPGGVQALITGWGYTSTGYTPDYLQMIYLNMLSVETCQKHSYFASIYHICTFNAAGQGVCSGDSGSPLVYNGKVVGIDSFGYVPCAGGHPDYFTRVYSYREWITQNVQ